MLENVIIMCDKDAIAFFIIIASKWFSLAEAHFLFFLAVMVLAETKAL